MSNAPALHMLRRAGFTISGVARRYSIDRDHLANVLNGRVNPSHDVRVALTDALDLPITEIFDADVLGRDYRGRSR